MICEHTSSSREKCEDFRETARVPVATIEEDHDIINKKKMGEEAFIRYFKSAKILVSFCCSNYYAQTVHDNQEEEGGQWTTLSEATFRVKEMGC